MVSKVFCSTSSMFTSVFIDILFTFVQIGLENFGKIIKRPPPFSFLRKSKYFSLFVNWYILQISAGSLDAEYLLDLVVSFQTIRYRIMKCFVVDIRFTIFPPNRDNYIIVTS